MDILYRLFDTMAVVIESVMCFVFVASFMKENKTRNHFTLFMAVIFLNIIIDYVTIFVQVYSVLRFVLFISTTLLVQNLIYKKGYGKILLLTITYMLFLALIDYSTVSVMAYLSGMEFMYFQKITLSRVCGIIISKLFLFATVILIQKKLKGLKMLKGIHIVFLLAISAFIMFFAFYMFQNFMQRNQISGSETIMFLLLLLIELLSFYSFSAMVQNKEKEEKLNLLDLYNSILQKSLQEEKFRFDLWSGKVHDYKNHVVYMLELLETKEYEKLKLSLWKLYEHNRDGYTNAKHDFISEHTQIAKAKYRERQK